MEESGSDLRELQGQCVQLGERVVRLQTLLVVRSVCKRGTYLC